MKRIIIVASMLVAGVALGRDVKPITVTSSAFTNGGPIPSEYTCEGKQSSPPLNWSALPPETKSVAIVVDDPDAPGGTFEHLVMYNLPPNDRALPSQPMNGLSGKGTAAQNSNQKQGWAPICPPSGTHHYRFVVLALDTTLNLPANATSRDVDHAMRGHVIARGELDGTYQKHSATLQPARPLMK